jgi:pimeloyl-ACP methyl ester carboxylesterase
MTATGILATATAALAIAPTAVEAQDVRSGYVAANGVDYYYEIRGSGEPLLLLHGGLGSTGMFEPIMPQLAEHRQVIAVDLQVTGARRLAIGRSACRPWVPTWRCCWGSSATSRSTFWATRWAAA